MHRVTFYVSNKNVWVNFRVPICPIPSDWKLPVRSVTHPLIFPICAHWSLTGQHPTTTSHPPSLVTAHHETHPSGTRPRRHSQRRYAPARPGGRAGSSPKSRQTWAVVCGRQNINTISSYQSQQYLTSLPTAHGDRENSITTQKRQKINMAPKH